MWEFPAVSQSRIEFWKKPQYTQEGMFWFTLFFGVLGLQHFLLRSPQTGLLFLIVNVFTLGYWYFYDVIQLSSYGGHTTETLNKFGLSHPWGAAGIAQGMWMTKEESKAEANSNSANDNSGPPSPWWFLAYCVLLPFGPLSSFMAGDKNDGYARLLDLLIVPGGFIWNGAATLWSAFMLFFKPATVCVTGTPRFFPWTVAGMDLDGHSPNLTGVQDFKQCPRENYLGTILRYGEKWFWPLLNLFFPGAATSIRLAISATQKASGTVVRVAQTGAKAAETVGKLATEIPGAVGKPLADAQAILQNPAAAAMAAARPVPAAPAETNDPRKPIQQGGGLGAAADWQPLDVAALGTIGALIGGGFLLTAGRKLFQNVQGPDDSPPNARAV